MIVLGWGKPLGYDRGIQTPFHAVVAITGGSFVTACHGRWSFMGEDRFVFNPIALLLPGEHDLVVTKATLFLCHDHGHVFRDPGCIACIHALGLDQTDTRAAELERARRAGVELIQQAEVC